MKKETADKLAYEFALACGANSVHKLDTASAKDVADFIQGLSQSFQQNLSDFEIEEPNPFPEFSISSEDG